MTETLKLSELKPSPLNPREKVGNITELAASIASVGVLQPLVVTQVNGHYEIVAGHRRYEAAKKAGLKEVPVVIRKMAEVDQVTAMVIENMQREDLSPIEEGEAFLSLLGYGIKRKDIAKRVGKSASYVGDRINLLDAPEIALKALAKGEISIADTLALVKLKEMPKRAEAAMKEGKMYGGIPAAVAKQLKAHDQDEQTKAAQARLKEAGVKVVKRPGWQSKTKPLGTGYGEIALTEAKHRKEPCHAGFVDVQQSWQSNRSTTVVKVRYACTDPDRHLEDGESEVKLPKEPEKPKTNLDPTGASARLDARQKLHEEAAEKRKLIAKKAVAKPNKPEVDILIQAAVIHGADCMTDLTNELLGVDEEVDLYDDLLDMSRKSPEDRRRIALVLAIDTFEQTLGSFRNDWTHAQEYFDLLGRYGHVPTELEREKLNPPQAEEEAADEGTTTEDGEADLS